jgi:hypothetical protein
MTLERIIAPRHRQIAGTSSGVERLLPHRERRMVGPFIFADLMGPDDLVAGQGVDVPPHPHIGLATVTYLFQGALVHRDSTGATQEIVPGGVNWMTAGGGVAHSERTPAGLRLAGSRLAGLQTWVALPVETERGAASFEHAGPDDVPVVAGDGATVRLLVGTGFGAAALIGGASPLFHADVDLAPGGRLALPTEHEERAVLVISGEVDVDGERIPERHLAVVAEGDGVVTATTSAQVMTFGGAPLGRRFIWWNFVASTEEQIEDAKVDWAAGRFAPIPDDDGAPVPLPAAGG